MKRLSVAVAAGLLVAASGLLTLRAQEEAGELPVADPICSFFGPEHDHFVAALRDARAASHLTEEIVSKLGGAKLTYEASNAVALLPSAPGGSRTDSLQNPALGTIDKYIFQKLAEANVAPAPPTTDYEFVRRVTLDLTGRIPPPQAVNAFVADTALDKRAKLVDALLETPQWVDKWTIWFADHLENNSNNDIAVRRFPEGVSAFNSFIRTSLQQNKPYNQMVREVIAPAGMNSYQQGELNFLVGGVMGGGPIQDVFDLQAANVAEKFLGLAHLNCLLCHSGRGHLDSLSLWGYYKTRNEAYGMASFMSHTMTAPQRFDPTNNNIYYWSLQNNVAPNAVVGFVTNRTDYRVDYRLNTQTGNRPARGATNSQVTVRPSYIMNGAQPAPGSDYRAFLAEQVTNDFQFARATVNYLWEYFFGIGIVSPSNQFDPMRLDPDNPPADCPLPTTPCDLQPSHPRMLNALAQDFINSGYDLKALMRQIVTSRAYQLSARYEGEWNPANERLFARKLVRRLWSEEIHDAVVQSFGVPVTYTNNTWNPPTINWAMQLPEPIANAAGLPATLLNAFLRGNRDDQARSGEPSISQALAMMNDPFIMNRVRATGGTNNNLLTQALRLTDDQAVATLYLTVLSRLPSTAELNAGVANLRTPPSGSNRTLEGQHLLWSLYNKVDFIYNY